MKVKGRYGTFTPRADQVPIYAKRAKAQKRKQAEAARSLAAWLDKHKSCANGCGKPVAFYDTVHYALRHGGCCSEECYAALAARTATEEIPGGVVVDHHQGPTPSDADASKDRP